MKASVQNPRFPSSQACHPSVYAACIEPIPSRTGSQTRIVTDPVNMVRRLREKSQMVIVIAAVTSLILMPVLFYGTYEALHTMTRIEEENTTFKSCGGSEAFGISTLFIGIMEFLHLISCCAMYCCAKHDDAFFIRGWLKLSVALVCFYAVLGIWAVVLLFAANLVGAAVGVIIVLLIIFSTKIISNLIVFRYHREIAPGHLWGCAMNVFVEYADTTCQPVFHTPRNRDTVVLVA